MPNSIGCFNVEYSNKLSDYTKPHRLSLEIGLIELFLALYIFSTDLLCSAKSSTINFFGRIKNTLNLKKFIALDAAQYSIFVQKMYKAELLRILRSGDFPVLLSRLNSHLFVVFGMSWLFLVGQCCLWATVEEAHSLEEVVEHATEENRMIVAVFLKSKECPWSQLFIQEILSGPPVLEEFKDQTVFWTPILSDRADAKSLINYYQLVDLPVVLLLDPYGREFYRISQLPIDKSYFIHEIQKGIKDFQQVCEALDQKEFQEEEWKGLYEKAKRFSTDYYAKAILDLGVQKEKGIFFHLEKYESLLRSHKKTHPQLTKLKKQIFKKYSGYQQGVQFQLAAAEFRHKVSRKKQKRRLGWVLKPLVHYLREYGKKDKGHRWRAEWMIAEYLVSRELFSLALEHARAAYEFAPDPFKEEVAQMIRRIQNTS